MKYEDLPPQIQNQLQQLQQFQQQLQITAQQHQQLDFQIKENISALEEVDKTDKDTPIYKSVGTILIKKEGDDVKQELQERKESLEVRKKSIEKQEQRLREKVEEIQNKLQGSLSQQAG
jgi:prefoldin beta subunit